MTKLLLRNNLELGDCVVMTAAMRDLDATYPGEFAMSVECKHPQVFDHLPYVLALDGKPDLTFTFPNGYLPRMHFIDSVRTHLQRCVGKPIMPGPLKPNLLLSAQELALPPLVRGPYWVMLAGGKRDCQTKIWPNSHWQQVVNQLPGRVLFVQAGGQDREGYHRHTPLDNVVDRIGKTDLRQFIRLIAQSQGVVCGITGAVHIAAAFDKPCVVIAGGREDPHVARYPTQQYLQTFGTMPCCQTKGCWRLGVNKPVQANPAANPRHGLCEFPDGDHATCMTRIRPAEVQASIERYLDGMTPPASVPAFPARTPEPVTGISFLVRTDARHPKTTLRTLQSLQRVVAYSPVPAELIVCGVTHPFGDLCDIRFLSVPDLAQAGRIGALRNLSGATAFYDTLVFADDDIFFRDLWAQRLVNFSYSNPWDALTCRLLCPNGTRHLGDRAIAAPAGDGRWETQWVPYDHDPRDPELYITGGLTILRRRVFDQIRWDDAKLCRDDPPEDMDLSRRLHAAGMPLDFDPDNKVWHATGGRMPPCEEFTSQFGEPGEG